MGHHTSPYIATYRLAGGLLMQAFRECDSPWKLLDFTFDELEKKWVDEIDFVICELCRDNCSSSFQNLNAVHSSGTGDNARYIRLLFMPTLLGRNAKRLHILVLCRHDNDRQTPRTTAEIFNLNREIVKRMKKLFLKRDIPTVPSLGEYALCHLHNTDSRNCQSLSLSSRTQYEC